MINPVYFLSMEHSIKSDMRKEDSSLEALSRFASNYKNKTPSRNKKKLTPFDSKYLRKDDNNHQSSVLRHTTLGGKQLESDSDSETN